MEGLNHLTEIMDRYRFSGCGIVPDSVDADFDRFSGLAPAAHVSEGLAEAFRSGQTPPFASMLSRLFTYSPANQKSNVLNTLVAALGPALVSQLLTEHGAGAAGTQLLTANVGLLHDIAERIPPSSIEAVAAEAEKIDPSIVDRISRFYGEQPALIKALGGLALTVAMAKVAQRQTKVDRRT